MKKTFIISVVTLLAVLFSGRSFSQYLVPTGGNNSITTCSGNLYDAGGSAGDYTNSNNGYTVINPNAGSVIQISGTSAGESCCDYVQVYNGVGTGGTSLGTYYMGTAIPTLTSTDPSGALTVRFYSDGSIVGAGFNITITCVAAPVSYNMTNGSTITTCNAFFYDPQGSAANYTDFNGSYTMTFCSGTAQSLKFVFTVFETNEVADYLRIYDVPTTGSPLLGTYSILAGAGTVVSSGTCLTFVWTTDNNNANTPGWAATISCVAPPPVNNDCANATALTVNPDFNCGTTTPGTVLNATASSQSLGTCGGTADDDVWFSFVATSTSHRVV
jgi:hypothetical protein